MTATTERWRKYLIAVGGRPELKQSCPLPNPDACPEELQPLQAALRGMVGEGWTLQDLTAGILATFDDDKRGILADAVDRYDPSSAEQDARTLAEAQRSSVPDLDSRAPLLGAIMDDALARIADRASGKVRPLATSWANVNRELQGGLWPGVYTLTGNPKSGKSQLALELALHAAATRPVLYVSLELPPDQLVARMLGLVARVPWSDLWRGRVDNIRAKYERELATLNALQLRIESAPPYGWHYGNLAPLVEAVKRAHNAPPFVVLDYLQLVKGDERDDLRITIGRAAGEARACAMAHDATILLVSSTARNNYPMLRGCRPGKSGGGGSDIDYSTTDPSEFAGMGKESGELEFSADGSLVLATDQKFLQHKWLIVAASRTSPTGRAPLHFDGSRFTVRDPRSAADKLQEARTANDNAAPLPLAKDY